ARVPGAAEPVPVPEAALPGRDSGSRPDRQRPDRIGPPPRPRGLGALGDRAPATRRTATPPGGGEAPTDGTAPAHPARTTPDARRPDRLLTPRRQQPTAQPSRGTRRGGDHRGRAPGQRREIRPTQGEPAPLGRRIAARRCPTTESPNFLRR